MVRNTGLTWLGRGANAAIEPLREDGLVHEIEADLFRQVRGDRPLAR